MNPEEIKANFLRVLNEVRTQASAMIQERRAGRAVKMIEPTSDLEAIVSELNDVEAKIHAGTLTLPPLANRRLGATWYGTDWVEHTPLAFRIMELQRWHDQL